MIIKARKIELDSKEEELIYGTSFFNDGIATSVSELRKKFGKETFNDNNGYDKTNIEFFMMLEINQNISIPFTIYDWKEYRRIKLNELIYFHIGARNKAESDLVKFYLTKIFDKEFSDNVVELDVKNYIEEFKALILNLKKQSAEFENKINNGEKVWNNFIPSVQIEF